jgi:hypothetical protein
MTAPPLLGRLRALAGQRVLTLLVVDPSLLSGKRHGEPTLRHGPGL